MMVEKTGLEAVFETAQFQQGLQTYIKGLAQAKQSTGDTASGIGSAGAPIGGLGAALGGLGPAAMVAGGALLGLGSIIIGSVVNAFKEAISVTKEFIGESLTLASRWEELDLVAQLMGQRMGLTSEDVHMLTSEMEDAGIRADVASKAIISFTRMELDPKLALELGKVAQNLAVISVDGADSSETLDRLMLGIQRLSPIILRYAGANVDLEQAYKKQAEALGITGRELTQVEKQQAAYNAVIEQGAMVEGAYELAMDSAGKQMRSLSGREIPTLKAAIGAPFQGAFLNVASAAREVVKTFTEAIQEGGALYPVMVALGAIADIITEALANLAKNGAKAVVDFFTWIANTFTGGADDAFEWGYNLVVEFAQGIIDAASRVLVQAINYLGSILAGWLAPGSPPKVAPDIIKWGVGAMTEYLKGFTKADFSILKNVQGPLKSAFDLMLQAGDISKKGAVKGFLKLNQEIAKALSAGTADESLFAKIAREAGEFGSEIAKLVKDQFALAKATDEVAAAQEAVNAAFEKQQGAEKAVRDLTDEYNRLLRAGATDEQLAAQLAMINAAEEQAVIAGEEKKAVEEGLADKQDALDILKEQVDLQSELIKQLMDLAKMAIVPGETVPGGAGGAGVGEGAGGLGLGEGINTDAIASKIREAVDAAKAAFINKWNVFKSYLIATVGESLRLAGARIAMAWLNATKPLREWVENVLIPLAGEIIMWVNTELAEATAYMEQWWLDHGDSVETIVRESWGIISGIYNTGIGGLETILVSATPVLGGLWSTMMGGAKIVVAAAFEDIKGIAKTGFEGLGIEIDIAAALLSGDWESIKTMAITAWSSMFAGITDNIRAVFFPFLTDELIPKVIELWGNFDLATIATDAWKIALGFLETGLKWVNDKIKIFHDWLVKVRDLILNMPVYKAVTKNSPVPMAEGLKEVNAGMSMFNRNLSMAKRSMGDLNGMSANAMIGGATATQSVIGNSSTRVMNMDQTNNIQSPMDLAIFQAMFNQVVRTQFSGVS